MRRLLPEPADAVDPADEYALPTGTPWSRANMVSTVDGAVTDAEGLSAGISGEADRKVFHVLRALTDAVVVGARTAQAERYRRAAVPVVVLTRSLMLDLHAPLFAPAPHSARAGVIVIAPSLVDRQRLVEFERHADGVDGLELATAGADELDLQAGFDQLRDRGLSRLLCEGGPTLLTSLIGEGLIDELCLTTSPNVVGGISGRIVGPRPLQPTGQPWRLAGLCEEDHFLFARWQPPAIP